MLNVRLAIKFIQIPPACIPCKAGIKYNALSDNNKVSSSNNSQNSPEMAGETEMVVEMTRCGKMVEKKLFYRYSG